MSVGMWKSLARSRPHTQPDHSARTPKGMSGPPPRPPARWTPNPNFQTSYLPLSRSSILSPLLPPTRLARPYVASSHRADNTPRSQFSHPFPPPRLYRAKSPLSYYAVLYVQISRKLRACLDGLLRRLVRVADPPFAPGSVFTLKGLAWRR